MFYKFLLTQIWGRPRKTPSEAIIFSWRKASIPCWLRVRSLMRQIAEFKKKLCLGPAIWQFTWKRERERERERKNNYSNKLLPSYCLNPKASKLPGLTQSVMQNRSIPCGSVLRNTYQIIVPTAKSCGSVQRNTVYFENVVTLNWAI